MTNTLAILIGVSLVAVSVFDMVFFDGENLIFVIRKLAELIEWLAFWR